MWQSKGKKHKWRITWILLSVLLFVTIIVVVMAETESFGKVSSGERLERVKRSKQSKQCELLVKIYQAAQLENFNLLTPTIGEIVRLDDTTQIFRQWWKNIN